MMWEVMNEETMRMGVENTETKARDIGGLLRVREGQVSHFPSSAIKL